LQSHQLTAIDKAGFIPIALNSRRLMDSGARDFQRKRLQQLLSMELYGVISTGADYWRHPYLDGYPPERRVMLFELDYPQSGCNAVLVDYESGFYQMTRHLIECGCRRIVFSASPAILKSDLHNFHHFLQMRNGYERALRENNLMGSCRYLDIFDNVSDDETVMRLKELLAQPERPDAIMTYMDSQAAQILRASSRLGCRVPEELRITGFYNTPWSCSQGRQLITTMAIDTCLMAQMAMEILSQRPATPRMIFLKPQLITGETTMGFPVNTIKS
jgi:DNA-binding LacI/PurR family transcriptional regulator